MRMVIKLAAAMMAMAGWCVGFAAQGAGPSPAFWEQLAQDIERGCVSNQKAIGSLELLKPEALTAICSCTARKATNLLRESKEFDEAYRSRNSAEMTRVLTATAHSKKGEPVVVACANEVRASMGGKSDAMLRKPTSSTATAGLSGKSRDAFVKASMMACEKDLPRLVPDREIAQDKLQKACACISEGMAKRMTDVEIGEIVSSGKLTNAQMADRRSVMIECAEIVNE